MQSTQTKTLQSLAETAQQQRLTALFDADPTRGEAFSASTDHIWLNYSRNHINNEALNALFELAKDSQLSEKISALLNGDIVNKSENRPAQHALLRAPLDKNNPDSVNIHRELDNMSALINRMENNAVIADTAITDVVCIGIGGSELGSKSVYEALSASIKPRVKLHFVANIDGAAVKTMMRRVNKASTLFLITSKTFTTTETMHNFLTTKAWFTKDFSEADFMARCFAITANPAAAKSQGFAPENIFEFWDWVGGRFSLWSTVGLPIAMAYGMNAFRELLAGAHEMDTHFQNTPFTQNLPVILGLVHVWNGNFMNYATRAVIPYAQKLDSFPDYLQQLEMESLGKSVDNAGNQLAYQSCPIVWGAVGSNSQHAFFQLLHQGTPTVPIDFIAAVEAEHDYSEHHNALLANCLAQSQSLMTGGDISDNAYQQFSGNKPSNLIVLDKITPTSLGQLYALYEHKVFVQSVMWDINAFDQWGVELGKRIAKTIGEQYDAPMTLADIKDSFSKPTE